jgi:putative salt-induced outer membrane protein YdiY
MPSLYAPPHRGDRTTSGPDSYSEPNFEVSWQRPASRTLAEKPIKDSRRTTVNVTRIAFGLPLCALTTNSAIADLLILNNGDRISGTLIEQNIDEIVLDTGYAGKLKIKRNAVVSVTTEQPLRIQLKDGQQLDGILLGDEQGNLVVQTEDGRTATVAGLSAISSLGAIPPDGPPPWEWRGNVTVAGESKTGNTETDKLNVNARTVVEQKGLNRFTVDAALAREESENSLTTEQYRLGGKYDRFFTKRWYGFVGTGFEQDKFKDLDLRTTLAAGSGYQFFDSDDLRLSLEAGLSYTDENFIVEQDNSYSGFNWGFNWEQALFDKRLNFFHRHRGNQGFDESDNLIINASTGVRLPIMAGISATAQYDIDWDNSPPDDADSTDQTYLFGLGYDW